MSDDSLDILVKITTDPLAVARAGEELNALKAAGESALANLRERADPGQSQTHSTASNAGTVGGAEKQSSLPRELTAQTAPDHRGDQSAPATPPAASADDEAARSQRIFDKLYSQLEGLTVKLERLQTTGPAGTAGSPASTGTLPQMAALEQNLNADGQHPILLRILAMTERLAHNTRLKNKEIADRLYQLEQQIAAAHNP